MHKIVNGKTVELTPEEERAFLKEAKEEQEKFEKNEYKELRRKDYGNIGDQLDMLYHDIQTMNTVDQRSSWYKKIKAIKDKYPKSEES